MEPQPAGLPSSVGTGDKPGPFPALEHQSRRVLSTHSTGGIPILDGVQRWQPVGAYSGLPVNYGRRDPTLRSFDDIPAHQDASEYLNKEWAKRGRELTGKIGSLQLNYGMRESELKQTQRRINEALSEKRKYDEECEERACDKRQRLAPEFKQPYSLPPRETGGLGSPDGARAESGLRFGPVLELAGKPGEVAPSSVSLGRRASSICGR